MTDTDRNAWRIFNGRDCDREDTGLDLARLAGLPAPSPWLRFDDLDRERARKLPPGRGTHR